METALSRALKEHREQHQDCRGCPEYLEIARKATQQRIVWAGPQPPHTFLSVREAS